MAALTGCVELAVSGDQASHATHAAGNMFDQPDDLTNTSADLPESVRNLIFQAAAEQWQVDQSQLQITEAQSHTWRDRCLELPRPNEKCVHTSTLGWRITVADGSQFYAYRTDQAGTQIRAEAILHLPPHDESLPYPVAAAVLQAAQADWGDAIADLQIRQAERRTWTDTCLELGQAGESCIQVTMPGWQVVVEGSEHAVYRTNEVGSLVRLDN